MFWTFSLFQKRPFSLLLNIKSIKSIIKLHRVIESDGLDHKIQNENALMMMTINENTMVTFNYIQDETKNTRTQWIYTKSRWWGNSWHVRGLQMRDRWLSVKEDRRLSQWGKTGNEGHLRQTGADGTVTHCCSNIQSLHKKHCFIPNSFLIFLWNTKGDLLKTSTAYRFGMIWGWVITEIIFVVN